MSKITTAYNAVIDALEAIFPSKTRIIDPYDLGNNPSHVLRDSYGIKKNSMTPGSDEICFITEVHSYSIVLTKEVVRTEDDITLVDTAYLALEEDMVTLRQRLFNVDQLGADSSIRMIELQSVSGLEFNYFDKGIFLSMECNFDLSITEELA